ncbi:transposase [Candidatus Hadarchaeum sp.]|uniref:transposase n=1 Tax=Candidatus Hadarchaeum sp. TaxID=2883567 RepID=UPI0038577E3A
MIFPRWGRPLVALSQVRTGGNTQGAKYLGQGEEGGAARVLGELRWVYTAENPQPAQTAWVRFRERWGRVYPKVFISWEGDLDFLLRFLRYPAALHPYLRSTNLLERFIHEVRRGTRVRDHQFPNPGAVEKLGYLKRERQEDKWEGNLGRVHGGLRTARKDVPGAVPSAIHNDTDFVTLPLNLLQGITSAVTQGLHKKRSPVFSLF